VFFICYLSRRHFTCTLRMYKRFKLYHFMHWRCRLLEINTVLIKNAFVGRNTAVCRFSLLWFNDESTHGMLYIVSYSFCWHFNIYITICSCEFIIIGRSIFSNNWRLNFFSNNWRLYIHVCVFWYTCSYWI
jgi:hypothetical protein